MNRNDLADYLEKLATTVLEDTKGESAEIRAGALVAWGLLRLGAALARQGLQPVEHITRLVDLAPDMDAVDKDAEKAADAKFAGEFGAPMIDEGNPYDDPPVDPSAPAAPPADPKP